MRHPGAHFGLQALLAGVELGQPVFVVVVKVVLDKLALMVGRGCASPGIARQLGAACQAGAAGRMAGTHCAGRWAATA